MCVTCEIKGSGVTCKVRGSGMLHVWSGVKVCYL